MKVSLFAISALIVLGACAEMKPIGTVATSNAPTLPLKDTCNAARYAALIGKPVTTLENQLHVGPVRILRPNTPMTLDLRPDRINFHVNDKSLIERISCV